MTGDTLNWFAYWRKGQREMGPSIVNTSNLNWYSPFVLNSYGKKERIHTGFHRFTKIGQIFHK